MNESLLENNEDIWKSIVWAYNTIIDVIESQSNPCYESLYQEQINSVEVDENIRFTFRELILGVSGIEMYRSTKNIVPQFSIEKVKTENDKWNEIMRYFSIDPRNLKCKNHYSFTKRNAGFVLQIILDYTNNPEFRRIKHGYILEKNSELLQKVIQGFREIMIDAGKTEYEIKNQTSQILKCTYERHLSYELSQISEKLKSKLYSQIDNLLSYQSDLDLMDQTTIYKHMWHEFSKCLRNLKRDVALMSDLRKLECDEDNPSPKSALYKQLCEEVSYSRNHDPEVIKISEKLSSLDNFEEQKLQERENLNSQLKCLCNQLFLTIHERHNLNPFFLTYCVCQWDAKSSKELYELAKDTNRNWYAKDRENLLEQMKKEI